MSFSAFWTPYSTLSSTGWSMKHTLNKLNPFWRLNPEPPCLRLCRQHASVFAKTQHTTLLAFWTAYLPPVLDNVSQSFVPLAPVLVGPGQWTVLQPRPRLRHGHLDDLFQTLFRLNDLEGPISTSRKWQSHVPSHQWQLDLCLSLGHLTVIQFNDLELQGHWFGAMSRPSLQELDFLSVRNWDAGLRWRVVGWQQFKHMIWETGEEKHENYCVSKALDLQQNSKLSAAGRIIITYIKFTYWCISLPGWSAEGYAVVCV